MALCLSTVFGSGAAGKGSVSWVSLLWMTPGLCGSVNGPAVYELLLCSLGVCKGGLVKGDGMSVLMGHMCCLLHLYFCLVLLYSMILGC